MIARHILILLCSLLLSLAKSQILAIDYGTQFIKASLVHVGAGKSFSIVENPKSNRKFINSLGLYNQERFYEAQTLTKRSKGPSNCFIFSRLLIDLHKNPSLLEVVKKDLLIEYLQDPNVDQLLASFVLANFPENENSISLLQTVGMMLKYIKLQAQKAAKSILKDTILIVPNYWSIHQRDFLITAAEMAQLYTLSIINENSAASINYVLTHRHTNDTQTILFYNLGANALQMTLVQFRQIKVDKKPKPIQSIFILGDYGKPYSGGLKLDSLICKYFASKFEQKYKKSLNNRGLIRLLAQSQKVKYVLSANKQAKVFVEGIMDGIDFISLITRKQFEQLAKQTIQGLISPIKRFLFDHDLRTEDLTGVQLIGGGTRIPIIQAMIGNAIQNASIVGSHINGDQSMAFGAAFYGANSSNKYKVKGIHLYDGFNFDMRIVLKNAQEGISQGDSRYYYKNVTLFKKKSRFGLTKQVSFKCKQNLIVQIYKEEQQGFQLLSSFNLNTIKDINESNYKISLTFQISPLNVIKLNQMKYLYSKDISQSYTEKVRKIVKLNKTSDDQKQVQEKSEQKPVEDSEQKQANEQQNQQSEDSKKQNQSQQNAEKSQAQDQTPKNKTENKKKKKQKIQYETIQKFRNVTKNFEANLPYKVNFKIFSQDQDDLIQKSKKLFNKYEVKQQFKRNLAQSKNKLEALIYELRDKLELEQFYQYGKEQQRTKLATLLSQKSTWYQQTTSNEAEDYLKQYRELNELVEKIKKRIVQHRERDDVKKRALDIIAEYTNLTSKVQKGKAWITDEEVASLNTNITQSKQRVLQIYEKLKALAFNQDSVFKNKDLIKQADIIKDQYFILKGKQKPKDFKQKQKSQEKKGQSQQKKGQSQQKKDKEQQQEEEVKSDEL